MGQMTQPTVSKHDSLGKPAPER